MSGWLIVLIYDYKPNINDMISRPDKVVVSPVSLIYLFRLSSANKSASHDIAETLLQVKITTHRLTAMHSSKLTMSG